MNKHLLSLVVCCAGGLLLGAACNKPGGPSGEGESYAGLETVTYTESTAIIANPERGFYSTRETHSAPGSPITTAAIDVARTTGRTLFLFEYYLTDYISQDIGADYLELIRKNFQACREGGAKALVRFAYSNGHSEMDRPWDASVEQVLRHVEQVKPILTEYADVLYVLQAGFVGSWGEWYYTDNFVMNPRKDEDYLPRKRLLDALLNAVPENRQIEVRTPTFKMKIYGYSLADTLTAGEAHKNSIKARIAGHNDCFLASDNDTGTFSNKTEREYWIAETRYTIMGGESCAVSKYCHCEDGENYDGALTTLEKYHFSYLHLGYHPDVLKRWREENCFDEVNRRLGYRFVLREAHFTEKAEAGKDYRVVLKLDNVGFAAPMNPRDAELVLTDASGKLLKSYPVNSDPRTWHSGMNTIDQTIQLPEGISGKVNLSLNLPDPETHLKSNPKFSIQLANENIWSDATGYNLLKTITVE